MFDAKTLFLLIASISVIITGCFALAQYYLVLTIY